jgi:pyrroline-5-carboxylate reductase
MAVIGGGNMGRALIGGLLGKGASAADFRVGESVPAHRSSLTGAFGVAASEDNRWAVAGAQLVILAVKPQSMREVLEPLRGSLEAMRPLVLSVAAGIRLHDLERWCGAQVPVVRAMPNRPALVGAGASALFAGPGVSLEQRSLAERTMQGLGVALWVPSEDALDAVTALSGSGPAYFFLLAELMAQAGQQLGLEAHTAQRLAAATLHGAGALVHASDGDLARLRAEVTSPGGTTEAAVRALTQGGLRDIVQRALDAAAHRSRELAAQASS